MREAGRRDHTQQNLNKCEAVTVLQPSHQEGLKRGPKTCISNQEWIVGTWCGF